MLHSLLPEKMIPLLTFDSELIPIIMQFSSQNSFFLPNSVKDTFVYNMKNNTTSTEK